MYFIMVKNGWDFDNAIIVLTLDFTVKNSEHANIIL